MSKPGSKRPTKKLKPIPVTIEAIIELHTAVLVELIMVRQFNEENGFV